MSTKSAWQKGQDAKRTLETAFKKAVSDAADSVSQLEKDLYDGVKPGRFATVGNYRTRQYVSDARRSLARIMNREDLNGPRRYR